MTGHKVTFQTPTGSQPWRISYRKLARNQHTKYYGFCHYDKRRIDIDPRLDAETALRTAIHEPTHVALGEDFSETAIERIEHNVYVTVCLLLRDRYGIVLEDE